MADDLSRLQVLGQGRLATVYRLDGNRVLKVFHRRGTAGYEYRKACQVWRTGVTSQQPCESLQVGEQEAIVYAYVPGEELGQWLEHHPTGWARCMTHVARCHAQILRNCCDELMPVRSQLRNNIENGPYLNEFERGCLLAGLADLPDGNALLHGDLHPYNILVHDDDPQAIDWMTACSGEPAADIARTYYLLRYAAMEDDRNPVDTVTRVISRWIAARYYLHRVCRLVSVAVPDVMRWLPFVAAARLREGPTNTEVQSILPIVARYCKRTS